MHNRPIKNLSAQTKSAYVIRAPHDEFFVFIIIVNLFISRCVVCICRLNLVFGFVVRPRVKVSSRATSNLSSKGPILI